MHSLSRLPVLLLALPSLVLAERPPEFEAVRPTPHSSRPPTDAPVVQRPAEVRTLLPPPSPRQLALDRVANLELGRSVLMGTTATLIVLTFAAGMAWATMQGLTAIRGVGCYSGCSFSGPDTGWNNASKAFGFGALGGTGLTIASAIGVLALRSELASARLDAAAL
ncbi:MAG: hypothetical protein K1X89_09505 [Myxococcaceae bacterium]|nr:hypothetical protein [Myxococcaceae bacterium]